MDYPSVSVVVPAYNAQRTIRHTLQALLSQSYSGEIEIIVVDDGSVDQTPEIVRSFREVRYLRQSNAGPAAARNRGAAGSKGEIILFTDSDCVPHENWVAKIASGFMSDEIAAVCGSYGLANAESRLAGCIHDEILYRHHHLMPAFPRAFGSYNVGIRRFVFWNVGGFDESYRRASGEDNDLSYKILNSGGRIFFVKDALVDHYHATRVRKYLSEQFRHGFWRAKMYADHPQMARGDDYTFWKDIVEVPWAGIFCLMFMAVVMGWVPVKVFILLIALPFWLIEIFFANIFCRDLISSFYFSFVMLFRAFARCFGLSTGILAYLLNLIKKMIKKNQIKS